MMHRIAFMGYMTKKPVDKHVPHHIMYAANFFFHKVESFYCGRNEEGVRLHYYRGNEPVPYHVLEFERQGRMAALELGNAHYICTHMGSIMEYQDFDEAINSAYQAALSAERLRVVR